VVAVAAALTLAWRALLQMVAVTVKAAVREQVTLARLIQVVAVVTLAHLLHLIRLVVLEVAVL
jgi:hypothetical protein